EVARRIQANATSSIHDAKVGRRSSVKRLEEESAGKVEAQRAIIRQSVSRFFIEHHVEFTKSSFRLSLEDGGYVMRAIIQSQTRVESAYRLDRERSEGWSHPRKVADIVGDELEVQVGMKKKFRKRALTREIVKISQYYVAGVDLDPARAEV